MIDHAEDNRQRQAEDYARGPWEAREVPGGLWALVNGNHTANVYSTRDDAEYWAAAYNYDDAHK